MCSTLSGVQSYNTTAQAAVCVVNRFRQFQRWGLRFLIKAMESYRGLGCIRKRNCGLGDLVFKRVVSFGRYITVRDKTT